MPPLPGARVLIFDNFEHFRTIFGHPDHDPTANETRFCRALNLHHGLHPQLTRTTRRKYRETGVGHNRAIDRQNFVEYDSPSLTQMYLAQPHMSAIHGKGILVYFPGRTIIPQSLKDAHTSADISHQEAHDQGYIV